MTASKPEVLPCPFCGAEPLEHTIEPHSHGGALKALGVPDHLGSHFIECGCGAGMIAEAKQAVRDMWNRREDARIAELEADAARYRWLRDHSQSFHTFYLSVPIWMAGVSVNQEKVDRSIDAVIALAQQGKEQTP